MKSFFSFYYFTITFYCRK